MAARTANTGGGRRGLATPGSRAVADPLRSGRVVRTLWPPAPGAKGLARQHGDALVCVRHRDDAAGLCRYVTVELVVEVRATPRTRKRDLHGWWCPVRLRHDERGLRRALQAGGARWDPSKALWFARADLVIALGLQARVVTRNRRC